MGPKTWQYIWLVSGLGVDNHRRWRRFRASDKTRATTADKRLVRPFLGYFSVSAHSVALEEIHRYCTLGLGRFAIAFLIIVVGRLVLKIEGRGTFLIDLSRCWKEGCF